MGKYVGMRAVFAFTSLRTLSVKATCVDSSFRWVMALTARNPWMLFAIKVALSVQETSRNATCYVSEKLFYVARLYCRLMKLQHQLKYYCCLLLIEFRVTVFVRRLLTSQSLTDLSEFIAGVFETIWREKWNFVWVEIEQSGGKALPLKACYKMMKIYVSKSIGKDFFEWRLTVLSSNWIWVACFVSPILSPLIIQRIRYISSFTFSIGMSKLKSILNGLSWRSIDPVNSKQKTHSSWKAFITAHLSPAS